MTPKADLIPLDAESVQIITELVTQLPQAQTLLTLALRKANVEPNAQYVPVISVTLERVGAKLALANDGNSTG